MMPSDVGPLHARHDFTSGAASCDRPQRLLTTPCAGCSYASRLFQHRGSCRGPHSMASYVIFLARFRISATLTWGARGMLRPSLRRLHSRIPFHTRTHWVYSSATGRARTWSRLFTACQRKLIALSTEHGFPMFQLLAMMVCGLVSCIAGAAGSWDRSTAARRVVLACTLWGPEWACPLHAHLTGRGLRQSGAA